MALFQPIKASTGLKTSAVENEITRAKYENMAKQQANALRSGNILGISKLYNSAMGDRTPIADKLFGVSPDMGNDPGAMNPDGTLATDAGQQSSNITSMPSNTGVGSSDYGYGKFAEKDAMGFSPETTTAEANSLAAQESASFGGSSPVFGSPSAPVDSLALDYGSGAATGLEGAMGAGATNAGATTAGATAIPVGTGVGGTAAATGAGSSTALASLGPAGWAALAGLYLMNR